MHVTTPHPLARRHLPAAHPPQIAAFTAALSRAAGRRFDTPADLQVWSAREWRTFWRGFIDWCNLRPGLEGPFEPVCEGDVCEHARFFPGLRLNWAGLLLDAAVAPDEGPALVACHADGGRETWSRGALRARVAQLADAFTRQGLVPGDRVVAVFRNDAEAATLALAVTAVGATLSVAAPDMGLEALAERFVPLAPRWLLAHGLPRAQDSGCPLDDKLEALIQRLPTLEGLVGVDAPLPLRRQKGGGPGGTAGAAPHVGQSAQAGVAGLARAGGDTSDSVPRVWTLEALASTGQAERFGWPRHPFNHPLFILFSSGTTGRPKAIVHGAGGTLLEHLKEHRLHCDLRPGERLYFHTSCSWMMWQWQLSALASGVTLVLYDGPVDGAETLWSLVARERVHVFGTSPAYLRLGQACGLEPAREWDLGALRAILSTGAVLPEAQFDWVARAVGPLPLQSICGGTDILGCFVLGHPQLPVRRGFAQCRSLGMDVQAWREGRPLADGTGTVAKEDACGGAGKGPAEGRGAGQGMGQLVCVNPFPSRPLGFYGDADGSRFHAAYFAENPGVWTHGDLVEFSVEGGARLHGRCDGLLNVRGIKLAPAEIACALEDEPQVAEVMVVEQAGDTPQEASQVLALLVLADAGHGEVALLARLRRLIAQRLSPAHVPDRFLVVPALPVTHNGKPSEAAARAAVSGRSVENLQALRNPEALDAIAHAARRPAKPDGDRGNTGDALARMQALWAQVLGLPAVGPDDHFMDLGGTSLHAAMIVSRLRRIEGCRLPLASLLRAPTPRQLADLARSTRQGQATAGHPLWAPLREGQGRPLVLVHGLSGTAMECWPLVQALRIDRPVAGLQARGLDGGSLPPLRVKAIAADYVEALRREQPAGPYALCGYSFGGLVALEMARRLHARGERIELLCLIDPYLRRGLPKWRQLWLRGAGWLARLGRMDGAARRDYLGERLRRIATSEPPEEEGVAGMGPRQRAVRESLVRSLGAYEPQPYAASPVLFVRARESLPGYFDPMPVWRRVLRGPLRVATLPGPHLDLVRGQAEGLARLLEEALRPGGGSPSPARPRSSSRG